jgi:hypothetical protein
MGPSQSHSKQSNTHKEEEHIAIAHPRFKNLKVITPPTGDDEGIIEIVVPLPNEN